MHTVSQPALIRPVIAGVEKDVDVPGRQLAIPEAGQVRYFSVKYSKPTATKCRNGSDTWSNLMTLSDTVFARYECLGRHLFGLNQLLPATDVQPGQLLGNNSHVASGGSMSAHLKIRPWLRAPRQNGNF